MAVSPFVLRKKQLIEKCRAGTYRSKNVGKNHQHWVPVAAVENVTASSTRYVSIPQAVTSPIIITLVHHITQLPTEQIHAQTYLYSGSAHPRMMSIPPNVNDSAKQQILRCSRGKVGVSNFWKAVKKRLTQPTINPERGGGCLQMVPFTSRPPHA
jgi:hypothetical protein